MRSRMIAAAVALVLAGVGTVVLLAYVKGVNARAIASAAPKSVQVLVAAAPIPSGAGASAVEAAVATVWLPEAAVLPDRITDIGQLAGRVSLVPFAAGEQLLAAKFGPPHASTTAGAVSVPPSFQQVTVLLRPEQALAGRIKPGQTVGVFVSLAKPEPGLTHLTVQKVLVTAVEAALPVPTPTSATTTGTETQSTGTPDPSAAAAAAFGGEVTATTASTTSTPAPPDPTVSVMVTLAVSTRDAEKVVYGAEHGSIWLSDDPKSADENGTEVVDGVKVFK